MPRIDLTVQQRQVLLSWLFSPTGYLRIRPVGSSLTAREVLDADGTTDMVQWKRDNQASGWEYVFPTGVTPTSQDQAEEMAAIWWVVFRWDGNNISPPNMPVEYPQWLALFAQWKQSILDAYNRRGASVRRSLLPIYDINGQVSEQWEQWYHLDMQITFIDRASNP